jgi:hypothetical protein
MISGSVVVPFQKGPCGEGGRMRGFLLPLLEETAVVVTVVVLVLLLIFFFVPSLLDSLLFDILIYQVHRYRYLSTYNTKVK